MRDNAEKVKEEESERGKIEERVYMEESGGR